MRKRASPQSEIGQSLLELALVLVLLLVLLAGVVDLGRMMYEYLTMRDAAQEGAGYGAVYPNDCAHIEARIKQNLPDDNYDIYIDIQGLSCEEASNYDYLNRKTYIKTLPDGTTEVLRYQPYYGCAGHIVTINIDHDSEITMPFIGAFLPDKKIPMHVQIYDRIVRPECSTVPND